MQHFDVALDPARPPTVLCLGAHPDDIEIGCGGTVLALVAEHPGAHFHWVVLSGGGERRAEATASADRFLEGVASKKVVIHEFRDGFLPYAGAAVKDAFERLGSEVAPDLVLTHHRGDLHQDHRLVAELTWNTFRDQLVLEYEIPKYDGDLGTPNVFVPLSRETCARKVETLLDCFASQRGKHWFSEDTFWSLLRLRGIESRSPTRYAEAFHGRKLVWGVGRAPS